MRAPTPLQPRKVGVHTSVFVAPAAMTDPRLAAVWAEVARRFALTSHTLARTIGRDAKFDVLRYGDLNLRHLRQVWHATTLYVGAGPTVDYSGQILGLTDRDGLPEPYVMPLGLYTLGSLVPRIVSNAAFEVFDVHDPSALLAVLDAEAGRLPPDLRAALCLLRQRYDAGVPPRAVPPEVEDAARALTPHRPVD